MMMKMMTMMSEEKGKRNNLVVSIRIRISFAKLLFRTKREKKIESRLRESHRHRIDFDASKHKTHPSVIIVLAVVDLIRVSSFELLLMIPMLPMNPALLLLLFKMLLLLLLLRRLHRRHDEDDVNDE